MKSKIINRKQPPGENRMASVLKSSAIIGTVFMSFNNLAIADPVSLSLNYSCPFPLIGDQLIVAQMSADYPTTLEIGAGSETVTLDSIHVETITSVGNLASVGLSLYGAATVTGTAHSINTFHTAAGTLSNNLDMDIIPTDLPETRGAPFEVAANGETLAVTFDSSHIGTVSLTVDDLIMNMTNLQADGTIAGEPVGELTVDCTLNPDQNNVFATFEVTALLAEADIDISPGSLDFGEALLSQSSDPQTITIKNSGGGILGINSISLTGADASAFTERNNCTTVASGESCESTVIYTASEEGLQSATLAIESDDTDEPSSVITLQGTGALQSNPEIDVDISTLSFGPITEGEQTIQTLVIQNTGTAALTISGAAITNNIGSEFTGTNNCATVAAGESCSAEITYAAVVGTSTGSITITSDDEDESSITIPLTGTGTALDPVTPCEADPSLPECQVNPCDQDPSLAECNDFVLDVALAVDGSTYMKANGGTLPLNGSINSQFNLTQGTFTGDLQLNPTQGSFEVIKGWSRYRATAQVEFESVGTTVGSLVDGKLTATSTAYIKVPKVTKSLFGLINWPIGGGKNCRTKEPVTFTVSSEVGESFDAFSGGLVIGNYNLPKLENCGPLTSILNLKMAGSGNTISLEMVPVFE